MHVQVPAVAELALLLGHGVHRLAWTGLNEPARQSREKKHEKKHEKKRARRGGAGEHGRKTMDARQE